VIDAFVSRFPEFAEFDGHADMGYMSLCLASVSGSIDRSVWGELYLEGIFCLAADMLMCDWFGKQNSFYAAEFKRLENKVHYARFGGVQSYV
jgi:hypothetical protein